MSVVAVTGSSSSTTVSIPTPKPTTAQLDTGAARSLLASGASKSSIVRMLTSLSKSGVITDTEFNETNARDLKRKLTEAATDHAKTDTGLYGPLVQSLDIGVPGFERWEYLNPYAFLYYLSSISHSFATMMKSISSGDRPLRIVLYADALIPGNPFRPEPSRQLMCIYWCIADWPQHVLQRSFAWPVFSIIRCKIMHQIQGGLSRLFRMILRIFFVGAQSFTSGIHIPCSSGDFVVTGIFAGFLADLVGHKEITEWKGVNGIICCLTCGNVTNCLHRAPRRGEVDCTCADRKKWQCLTDEDIWKIVDDLADLSGTMKPTPFNKICTEKGFNHVPEGILQDKTLRDIYKPANHMIRDWQHTMCQDGVANTHIFNISVVLKDQCDIDIEQVQDFSQLCHYPSNWGKLEKSAFGRQRIRAKSSTIASFSSLILSMVPVLFLFMERYVASLIPDHFAAFQKLHHILGILRLGPETAMKHTETLQALMEDYLERIVNLYGGYIKPKGHHMLHIVEGMEWVGRLLCCFVTERKHRMVKACALHVFRHIEHTVLNDIVNLSIEQIMDGHDLYAEKFLICPRDIQVNGTTFRRSGRCVMHVGQVGRGDLVINNVGDVGKVISVWQTVDERNHIFFEVDAYPCINNDVRIRATTRAYRDVFGSDSIIDVLIWYEDSPGIIRLAVPPGLLFAA